jgi:hypothetical protein
MKSHTDQSFDSPGSLIKRTRELLKSDKRKLHEIYRDTGIPFHWLRKFSADEIPNPSVNRVQYLYEKLSGKKIAV